MPGRPFDDDPPPKGSPRLMGDRLDGLKAFRRTVEGRSGGSPMGQSHLLHRNILIAAAVVKMGMSHQQVGDIFNLDRSRVTHILKEMGNLAGPVKRPVADA